MPHFNLSYLLNAGFKQPGLCRIGHQAVFVTSISLL